jgi:hypothetical protein
MKATLPGLLTLALLAALVYFLVGAGVLQPGDLQADDAPAGIAYFAGVCYVVGGLLILARKRWLWVIGAVINALVIVMLSPPTLPDRLCSSACLGWPPSRRRFSLRSG